MSERLRIGVIGAGLIAQCEHVPNLLALPELFALVGICDPSPTARAFVAQRFGVAVFPDSDALLGERLDAVLVASPDFTHVGETVKALGHGLHVLCEKPLCYGPEDADTVAAARDRASRVVQVGYMKRHDPSYEACLELLPDDAASLRFVSVETHDPDYGPFLGGRPVRLGQDLPLELVEAGRRAEAERIARAIGEVPERIRDGFARAYCSSLVHDVNAVHGLLERLGVGEGEVVGAEIFAGGSGGLGAVRLLDGQAAWQMAHLVVPKLADYRERIALYFDDRIVELIFPSPYLDHHPTRLLLRESRGERLERREIRPGFGEAFVRELEAFHAAVAARAPVVNMVERARRDQALLCALARHAARLATRGSRSVMT